MKLRCLLAIVLVLISLSVALPVLAQEAKWVGSEPIDSSNAAMVETYWTEERMKNAIPYPMFSPEGSGKPSAVSREYYYPNQADGKPGASSPSGVELSAAELALLDAAADGEEAGFTWPFPFTMYEVRQQLIWRAPYRYTGRLFFVTSSGSNSSCSGSSIGNRAVLTAGHCVSNGSGSFHHNWLFRPGYRDYGTPISNKSWAGIAAWTFSSWHNYNDYCRDVGAVITELKAGQTLQQFVGAYGHAWNWNAAQTAWAQFGYPAEQSRTTPNYLFNGSLQYENHAGFAEYTADWWEYYGYSCYNASDPVPFCIGSYMTGGSSGGPLVVKFAPIGGVYPGSDRNYANGVNSTYFLNGRVAGGMCSPYFDTTVHNFIVNMWDQ